MLVDKDAHQRETNTKLPIWLALTIVMSIQQNQAVVKSYINRKLRDNQEKEHSNTVELQLGMAYRHY